MQFRGSDLLWLLICSMKILYAEGQLTSKFERFQGYGISNTSNFTVPCDAENKCIENCLNSSICTAISINYGVPGKCKPGKLNNYGRVLLQKQSNWTTWIRGMFDVPSLFFDVYFQISRN